MRHLDNEYIIKLYEVYESDQHIYLVLELLNGGELFNKITDVKQNFEDMDIKNKISYKCVYSKCRYTY